MLDSCRVPADLQANYSTGPPYKLIEIKQPSIALFEPSLDRIWLCVRELPPYEVGDEIFAWLGFSGGVADSYPPQTSANRIWRIKSADATD